MANSDAALLERWIAARDGDAFAEIVSRHSAMVYGACKRITGNPSDAEDVAQECFIELARVKRVITPSLPGWLHRVAVRRSFNRIKADSRRKRRETRFAEEVNMRSDGAWDDIQAHIDEAIAALPDKLREPIIHRFFEGQTHSAIARKLGISDSTVQYRVNKGIQEIRRFLKRRGVVAPAAVLASLLGTQLTAEAAPASLTIALGKLALAGGIRAMSSAATSATSIAALGGVLIMKKAIIGVGIVLAVGAGIWGLTRKHADRLPARETPPESMVEQEEEIEAPQVGPSREQHASLLAPQALPDVPAQAHAISGRVIEEVTEEPIAGVAVGLRHDGRKIAQTITEELGRFQFSDIADGRYELYLDRTDTSVRNEYYFPRDREQVSVSLSGEDAENLTLSLHRGTYISGIVVDQDKKPVPEAALYLDAFMHTPLNPATKSESDGRFRFAGLLPGQRCDLACEAPGYASTLVQGLIPTLAKPVEDFVIRLTKGQGATLSGWVINLEGLPVEHALVQASVLSVDCHKSFLTGVDGTFSFHDVPPGSVFLYMNLYDKYMSFDVRPNEIVDDIELVVDQEIQGGYVSGVIVDTSGQPIRKGIVLAQPAGKGPKEGARWHERYSPADDIAASIPDEEGNFKLVNLKPSTHVDILYWLGPRQATSATNIPVPTRDLVVVFKSTAPEGPILTVRGRVMDERTREPIKRFSVASTHEELRPLEGLTRVWDRGGVFEIEDVRYLPGKTYVYAEADGYAGAFAPVVAGEGAKEAFVELMLGSGAIVAGRVIDMVNSPVGGARLRLLGGKPQEVMTNSQGAFEFTNVMQGSYCFLVSHPDYASLQSPLVEVQENTDITDYIIQLGQGGTVTGLVLDDAGNPVKHADVRIIIGDIQNLYHARTDQDGVYIAELIPAGVYRVNVPTVNSEVQQVLVAEGKISYADFGVQGSTVWGTAQLNGVPGQFLKLVISDVEDQYQGYELHILGKADRYGNYRLRGVPAGEHYLMVCDGHELLASVLIDVPESASVQRDFDIR